MGHRLDLGERRRHRTNAAQRGRGGATPPRRAGPRGLLSEARLLERAVAISDAVAKAGGHAALLVEPACRLTRDFLDQRILIECGPDRVLGLRREILEVSMRQVE